MNIIPPKLLTVLLLSLLPLQLLHADVMKRNASYNNIAFDFPFNGGLMIMGSHMWRIGKHVDVGFVGGGGQINRDFKLKLNSGRELDATTSAVVFPFAGPQLSFYCNWVGISLGYAAYKAKVDLEVDDGINGKFKGETSGWGSGFYSPFLTIDFYDTKRDLVYGFGLGGFFGSSFKKLEASNGSSVLETDSSPIDTLTFQLRLRWTDARTKRLEAEKEKDEDF